MTIDLDKLEALVPEARRALAGTATLADTAVDEWRTKKEIQMACKSDREAACGFYEAIPELIRLARIGEKVQWRPIEEAKKDGSRILATTQSWSAPMTVQYYNDLTRFKQHHDLPSLAYQPTYFIPLSALPEPPK
jgi:hypothetical protein